MKDTKPNQSSRPPPRGTSIGRSGDPLMMTSLLTCLVWMDRCLQRNVMARGWERLSRAESQVMLLVWSGTCRPIDIARTLGASRQAINQTLKLLVGRNLLELVPDPDDGRCKIVRFTETDTGMRRDALDVIGQIEETLAERLGNRNFECAKRTLALDWGDIPVFPIEGKRGKPSRNSK